MRIISYMFNDLIEYEVLNECCTECFGFGKVTMLRDFGPWKKGDKVSNLWFNIDGDVAEAVEYHDDGSGERAKTCKFQLVAI